MTDNLHRDHVIAVKAKSASMFKTAYKEYYAKDGRPRCSDKRNCRHLKQKCQNNPLGKLLMFLLM